MTGNTTTRAAIAATICAFLATTTHGHAVIDAPNGGETLRVGSTYDITWTITISHSDLMDWDVYYSTVGPDGPWTEIAIDLPPGDPEIGAVHTYTWTVPDDLAPQAWVRVVMDLESGEFEDVSDAPFTIAPPCADVDGDGVVGTNDLLIVLSTWGRCGTACEGDLDGDGFVEVDDLIAVLAGWGEC